ncbi:MAG: magnesium transporter [Nanobdellota archaeon]
MGERSVSSIVSLLNVSSSKTALRLFKEQAIQEQGFLILKTTKKTQRKLLSSLKDAEICSFLHYLDPDETTDIIQSLSSVRRHTIINKLHKDIRKKVEFLLQFDPRTAAGMMSLDYVIVQEGDSFSTVSELIKKHESRTGKVPVILVLKKGKLVGQIPIFILASTEDKVIQSKDIQKIPTVHYDAGHSKVLSIFKKNPHDKIIVLDEDLSVLGVIFSDDILSLLHKNSANSIQRFAGIKEQEDPLDPVHIKVKNRYGWLILNLLTAFLASSIVALFQDVISAVVLLAVYMPIIAGMGGNAGTQTLAIVIRGLTLNEISLKECKKVVVNEVIAGAINGLIIGVLVAGVAIVFNQSPLLGLVVGLSMIINLLVAGLFGTVFPLILQRLGKDPATSASIFITTATDVFGFFVFLGLASLLLV